MTANDDLPVRETPERCSVTLVVPVGKVSPDLAVGAAVQNLRRQGPVAMVYAERLEGEEQREPQEWPVVVMSAVLRRTPLKDQVVAVDPEASLDADLPAILRVIADLAEACQLLTAAGRHVVLVGPALFHGDERNWLYQGLTRSLADRVVLCVPADYREDSAGLALQHLLSHLGPGVWESVALVEHHPRLFDPEEGAPTLGRAAAAVRVRPFPNHEDGEAMRAALGHFLGVLALPEDRPPAPNEVDACAAVLASQAAPLVERLVWVRTLDHDERAEQLASLVELAVSLQARTKLLFPGDDPLPADMDQLLQEIPSLVVTEQLSRDHRRRLAFAVAELAGGQAGAPALVHLLRSPVSDPDLEAELVIAARQRGESHELDVLRTIHASRVNAGSRPVQGK